MKPGQKSGKLYIVSTPIGNPADITLRAIEVLQQVDAVICEEFRQGSTLLKRLKIENKELLNLNEHNEIEFSPDLVTRLLLGANLALISDCGTPAFSDPGATLIALAVDSGIDIIPVPGASSLMAALSILDFKLENFVFCGFLARNSDQRRRELSRYRSLGMTLILMDAPYRLAPLLQDVSQVFGANCRITLACDLTLPQERIYRGTAGEVIRLAGSRKAEFILIIHATNSRKQRISYQIEKEK
jgi:16S rRNA (cytidine1402-2'-O)-methyltransferase